MRSTITFKPIDLENAEALCLEFRRDALACSFGDSFPFDPGKVLGGQGYIDWLRKRLEADPESCVHVWQGETIVGQMELSALKGEPTCGYVNLYYLIPVARGTGLAKALDDHATSYLRKRGFLTAKLSVSPTNIRAVRFYEKHGWRDIGPRPEHPEVHFMEKALVQTP